VRIEGTRELAAPRADVYRALTDPQVVGESLPLVGRVTVDDPDRWHALVRVPLPGRAAPKLKLAFEVVERREPERARLIAAGKSLGASLKLDSAFDLAEREGGGTTMTYAADVSLGGLLGRIPDATLQPVARRLVDGLLRSVERRAAG
jgi:carbon monoxide dehydrogenase subunit G